jgi:phosphoglycerate dehydrogenase-like enzyme
MYINQQVHQLLILSQDFETYSHLIELVDLPGLSIHATDDLKQAIRIGVDCDLLFGEPSLACKVVNKLLRIGWIQTTWAGVEPLMEPGVRQDYILTNARNVYGGLMSEYVFGYLLAIERQILPRWISQKDRKWDSSTPGTLRGKLIGLCGVGTIGSHLAATAQHFGMRVYGYTRKSETCSDVDRYYHGGNWQKFASDLDYLVCSMPMTKNTTNLVNASSLSALPRKAWFINIGRGSIVDEVALTQALTNQEISGAVLDVFVDEPLSHDHPLWSTPNTFITSHTAARNYLPDIANLFIENYKRMVAGLPLRHQVDFNQGY